MGFKQIYQVNERDRISIPLERFLSGNDFNISDKHKTETYFHFTIKNQQLVLHSDKYVGLIPLNDEVGIFVKPKIGTKNWMHLVGRANTKLRSINELRLYGLDIDPEIQIIEYIIGTLCIQLELVVRHGMFAEYTSFQTITQYPRGRIDFGKSITKAWAKGENRKVAIKYYEFSRNTLYNRYIKSALILSQAILASNPNPRRDLQEQIHYFLQVFKNIPLLQGVDSNIRIKESIKKSALPKIREYYYDILNTALFIIEHSNIDVFENQDFEGLSFVVDMETVFEKYCQNLLRENSSLISEELIVLDQSTGKKPLFSEGPDRRFAEPDILLTSNFNSEESVKLVIDVKYKPNPSRIDLNQIITYAYSYNTNKAMLLCYAENEGAEGGEYLGKINGKSDIWIYRIFLEGIEINENEERLISNLEEIIST